MTDYTIIHIATLIIVILVIFALAALTDYILEPWKKPAPPSQKRRVTWCDTHGHAFILSEDKGAYICGICPLRIERDPGDLPGLGLVGAAELGHQGQTGRAA